MKAEHRFKAVLDTNVWISDDQGDSWSMASSWSEDEKVRCLAIAPSDGNVIYTGQDNDRDIILTNIGGVVPTNIRTEQLP